MGKDNYIYFTGFYNYHERMMNELDNYYIRNGNMMSMSVFCNRKREKKTCFRTLYYSLIDEINHYEWLGDLAIYSFCMEHLNNDIQLVEEFLLSEYGGFTKTEHSRAKHDYKTKVLGYREKVRLLKQSEHMTAVSCAD